MDPINPIARPGDNPPQSAAPDGQLDGAIGATLGEDFTTFLQLLTAQLQNQDPVNPMDTSQFVTQLTQFSELEQSVRSNDTLDSILEDLRAQGSRADMALVGQTVALESAFFELTPNGAVISYELDSAAPVQVEVFDLSDTKLGSFSLDGQPGNNLFVWDGSLAGAPPAPEGLYRIRVTQSGEEGGADSPVTTLIRSRVNEVRYDGTVSQLVLSNGDIIDPSLVRAVIGSS